MGLASNDQLYSFSRSSTYVPRAAHFRKIAWGQGLRELFPSLPRLRLFDDRIIGDYTSSYFTLGTNQLYRYSGSGAHRLYDNMGQRPPLIE